AHMARQGGGAILNVSSVAALYPHPGLMSYGMSKVALERLTVDAAMQLQPDGIAVNCFRIDVPVASEGFVANTPGVDRSTWEPCEETAEGLVWMVRQPTTPPPPRQSMSAPGEREAITKCRAQSPSAGTAPLSELFAG